MLSRYKIYRGKRPVDDPLPDGVRKDTRWRTRHVLRPEQAVVEAFLETPSDSTWKKFVTSYRELLERRFAADPGPFDQLVAMARRDNVFIGCSCPTQKNPDVNHCHTVLALQFLSEKYPDLEVQYS